MSTVLTKAARMQPQESRASELASFELEWDKPFDGETQPQTDRRPSLQRRTHMCFALTAAQVAVSLCCAVGQIAFADDIAPCSSEVRASGSEGTGAAAKNLF